jgi:hypothetical protein
MVPGYGTPGHPWQWPSAGPGSGGGGSPSSRTMWWSSLQGGARLVRLTIGDVIDHDGQVSIRLGDPGLGPPNPFAAMLTEMPANRATMNTAANPACLWLFPADTPTSPLTLAP